MSYHVSTTEVERAIGADAEAGLSDSDSNVIGQLIEYASSLVDAALINAGYTPPATGSASSNTPSLAPDLVKMATIGALLPQLYGRKGIKVPEQLLIFGSVFERVADGSLPINGLTPDATKAVGRVDFSESTDGVTDAKPKVFGSLRDDY